MVCMLTADISQMSSVSRHSIGLQSTGMREGVQA